MKILNFGSINIDIVYDVPHIVRPGETLASTARSLHAGGKGANQSLALARAGAKVLHAGAIGEDGRWISDYLQEAGVDTESIRTGSDPTGHAFIQRSADGENAIVLLGGANQTIHSDDILQAFNRVESGDVLLLQNEINALTEIIEQAHKKGLTIAFNPAPFGPEIFELPLDDISIFIVNETEATALAKLEDFDETTILSRLVQQYPNAEIILTMGKYGVSYAKGELRHHIDATPVTPVDTTAAGDTFIGYYLAERSMGQDVTASLRMACRAAGISVTRHGAAPSIPMRSELI